MKEDVIAKVMLKKPEITTDEALELVERAEEFFLNETNRLSVPKKAFWLWIDLSMEIGRLGFDEFEEKIKAISRGDTTITFADHSESALPTLYSRVKSLRTVKVR